MTDIDLAELRAKTEAALAEWDSKVPTPALRAFHTATAPAPVLALLDHIAGLERRASEAIALLDDHSCTAWDDNAARAVTLLCDHPRTVQKMHAVICGVCQIVMEYR